MSVSLKITIFVYLITDFIGIHLVLRKYPRRTMFPLPLYIFHTARLRCSVHRPFPGWTWLLHQYLEDSILLWNKKRNDALHQRMSRQGVLHLFGMNVLQIYMMYRNASNQYWKMFDDFDTPFYHSSNFHSTCVSGNTADKLSVTNAGIKS